MERPSPFFLAWWSRLREAATLGPVADVACGRGRHALALARDRLPAIGLDRDAAFLSGLAGAARAERLRLGLVRCDLEAGGGLPLAPGRCGAALVFRYLHRPLTRTLAAALRPGGLLLYETFTLHQRDRPTGPRNPAFLLDPGELPTLFPDLEVLAHEEGDLPAAEGGPPFALARLAARKPAGGGRAARRSRAKAGPPAGSPAGGGRAARRSRAKAGPPAQEPPSRPGAARAPSARARRGAGRRPGRGAP